MDSLISNDVRPAAVGLWVFAVTLVVLTGCGQPLLHEGARCGADADCAGNECVELDGVRTCSTACLIDDVCPASADGSARACREDGYCHAPCSFTGARDGQVCRAGAVVECASLAAADACSDCGCDAFGGGICVPTMGCVQPGPAGASCTEDRFCASGLCDPGSSTCIAPIADGAPCTMDRFCVSSLCNPLTDLCTSPLPGGEGCESNDYCASGVCGATSHVCVDPAALGEPCSTDGECASDHCSTNGDATRVGVCEQPLGEVCDGTHCSRCVGRDRSVGFEGYCLRDVCDPVDAPCGPPVGEYHRMYDCRVSAAGPYHCYETCPTDTDGALGYHCLDLAYCHAATGSCY
jgi:hypothetical protein